MEDGMKSERHLCSTEGVEMYTRWGYAIRLSTECVPRMIVRNAGKASQEEIPETIGERNTKTKPAKPAVIAAQQRREMNAVMGPRAHGRTRQGSRRRLHSAQKSRCNPANLAKYGEDTIDLEHGDESRISLQCRVTGVSGYEVRTKQLNP